MPSLGRRGGHRAVTLVDGKLTGGPGISPFAGSGHAGKAALEARDGGVVLVAGPSLPSGDAGQGLCLSRRFR